MGWDCLNRMISLTNSPGTESYNYRADGMRVSKSGTSSGTVYRYDGQMGIEDVDAGSSAAVTDYALGARGIDAISKTVGNNTTVVYPVYDAHGNMMGDISRSGSSFSVNDKRSFDAWGNIRQGAQTGDPKGRYCANLGHKQDDESGLVYMRARYYEPASGRFISEDLSRCGRDWFVYSNDIPTCLADFSGNDPIVGSSFANWFAALSGAIAAAGGFLFGFFIASEIIQHYVTSYSPNVPWLNSLLTFLGGGIFSAAGPSLNVGGGIKLSNLLAKTALQNGVAFLIGFIFGVEAAQDEFELWYIDNSDSVPF